MNEDLVDVLRQVTSAFLDRLQEMGAVAELELAPYQARLLSLIGRRPAISQLELATSTERDKAQVARAIKELEKRGFVVRSEHATDWRTRCLTLSEEGSRAWELIDRERKAVIDKALRECSSQEQHALRRTLKTIIRSLG